MAVLSFVQSPENQQKESRWIFVKRVVHKFAEKTGIHGKTLKNIMT